MNVSWRVPRTDVQVERLAGPKHNATNIKATFDVARTNKLASSLWQMAAVGQVTPVLKPPFQLSR